MNNVQPENSNEDLKVAIAQIAPVWLNREQTLEKIIQYTNSASDAGCRLVVFGEGVLPGYPFWIELTDGARFNSQVQKEIHAHYMDQAVQIESGHLDELCRTAAQKGIAVYVGCIERAADRGGHSLYCSLVYIDLQGVIQSIHRKLMPTYEERLTWAQEMDMVYVCINWNRLRWVVSIAGKTGCLWHEHRCMLKVKISMWRYGRAGSIIRRILPGLLPGREGHMCYRCLD